jgi:hypothetical protein
MGIGMLECIPATCAYDAVLCMERRTAGPSRRTISRQPSCLTALGCQSRSRSRFFLARWILVRKVMEGEPTNDLFAFLTIEPNKVVGAIHPKDMPVFLTTPEELDLWMAALAEEA